MSNRFETIADYTRTVRSQHLGVENEGQEYYFNDLADAWQPLAPFRLAKSRQK